ncbi:S8 family serine peptidase [Clostridium sp.]|uniref:S8 family serine peptidase n=1 Tax=Clostridium sp. TaxID=1506 RepID=UPI003216CFEB
MKCRPKNVICCLITIGSLFILNGCGNSDKLKYGEITDRPKDTAEELYKFNSNKTESERWAINDIGSIDLTSTDLTHENLTDKTELFKYFQFDTKTLWPTQLPDGIDPNKLLEQGKDPGLNIRELHKKGITGKGVGIAIIDQALLVDHEEYKEQIAVYHSYSENKHQMASMHGPGVASLAVGKNIGVAPDTKLYYISDDYALYGERTESGEMTTSLEYLSKDIDRIIELNKSLNDNEKIRVISISIGYTNDKKDRDKFILAVERAKNEGIEVLCLGDDNLLNQYIGMGRTMYGNSNVVEDLRPAYMTYKLYNGRFDTGRLLVPMDQRTVASSIGTSDYLYTPIGGGSWIVPYVAGLYALACQVDSQITFEEFTVIARETGKITSVTDENGTYEFGTIIDPIALINKLQNKQ